MNSQFDRFRYTDETTWGRVFTFFNELMLPVEFTATLSPIEVTNRRWYSRKIPSLPYLGELLEFRDPTTHLILQTHRERLRQRGKIFLALGVIFLTVLLGGLLAAVIGIKTLFLQVLEVQTLRSVDRFVAIVFGLAMIFIIYSISAVGLSVIAVKFAAIITDRYFADTLCVTASLYLLVDLDREDVLRSPQRKKRLLKRIRALANWTLLLALRHASSSAGVRQWTRQHFRSMEQYIRERERWAIAPTDSTLMDLRRDFRLLTELHVHANYGLFQWEAPDPIEPSQRASALRGGLRVIGFFVPLLVLGVMLLYPEMLNLESQATSALPFLFMAWLLLTIDSLFNLGVIAGVINLAKGLKELK